ncbi:UDP-glucose 4-epimerase GalE [Marivita sp. S0852]|uniref:UDP-glucose 4-epimerase GalE n=1 Tax=Marivita sp. S0852 TaxID=3373893 RepID=UPI003981BA1A
MTKCILATGGAGYIGSHTTVELLNAGYSVVIIDNFENSARDALAGVPKITGGGKIWLVEGDVRNARLVADVIQRHSVDAVIHFAGKKAVGESVADPLLYYHDNINGALSVLSAMRGTGCKRLVFSSSATVYGDAKVLPIPETALTCGQNPYGRSKLMIEDIIDDFVVSTDDFHALSLRYFNPVGAHPSGFIGENPNGPPNNLFPFIVQAAAGMRNKVQIFGNDYETHDGTGSRDYIHVVDLARGHVAAVEHLFSQMTNILPHRKVNLGTGKGHTVLEVLNAFSKVCGFQIPYQIGPRRPGDVGLSLADPSLASALFNWSAELGLEEMCRDHWRFQVAMMEPRIKRRNRIGADARWANRVLEDFESLSIADGKSALA